MNERMASKFPELSFVKLCFIILNYAGQLGPEKPWLLTNDVALASITHMSTQKTSCPWPQNSVLDTTRKDLDHDRHVRVMLEPINP